MFKHSFSRECLTDAWQASSKILGWKWPKIAYTALGFLVGALVVASQQATPMDSLTDWALAAAAGLVLPVSVLVFNLLASPRRIWIRDQDIIGELRAGLAANHIAEDLAERLEDRHRIGELLLGETNSPDFRDAFYMPEGWFTRHIEWFESTLSTVAESGDEERFMFESSVPRPAKLSGSASPRQEMDKLRTRLGKLRLITARCYKRASGH